MKVQMGKFWLAEEGAEGTDQFRVSSEQIVQVAPLLRATYVKAWDRGNWQHRISFRVHRVHDSILEAEEYICRHTAALVADAVGGLVCIYAYTPGSNEVTYYLHDGKLSGHEAYAVGVSTFHTYTLIGGQFSTTEPE